MRNYNADKSENKPSFLSGNSNQSANASAKAADQHGGHGSIGGKETPCSCPGCFPMDW